MSTETAVMEVETGTAMSVICNRGELVRAMSAVLPLANARSPRPVLGCVKIATVGDAITLEATNLEQAARIRATEVQIEMRGVALVSAEKLYRTVAGMTDQTVTLKIEGDTFWVRGADGAFSLCTSKPSDFPPIGDTEGEVSAKVKGADLLRAIRQTAAVIPEESSRYAFNGMLFTVGAKGKIDCVATDGRRLVKSTIPYTGGKFPAVIIPPVALSAIAKATDDEADVEIRITDRGVSFSVDGFELFSNVIEGTFPPYGDVIPKDQDKKLTTGRDALLSAVRQAAVYTTEESKGVRLTLSNRGLRINSRSPKVGTGDVMLLCKYEGADLEIGANPTFLEKAVAACVGDTVSIELTAPNRPMLVTDGGSEYLCVVMPLNLSKQEKQRHEDRQCSRPT